MLALFPLLSLPALAQEPLWNQAQKIVASDRDHNAPAYGNRFGNSVSLSGDYAVVGAPYESEDTLISGPGWQGAAYVFERNANGTWNEVRKLVAAERRSGAVFGSSVVVNGKYAMVGAPAMEAVYVFERNGDGVWRQVQMIVTPDDGPWNTQFGHSIAVSGNYAVVGAPSENGEDSADFFMSASGAAYIFERKADGIWSRVQRLVASDEWMLDFFGTSVSISGDYAIVGAQKSQLDIGRKDSVEYAGAAYIFKRDENGVWSEVQKITAHDREANDGFGNSVSVSGNYAIVGSRREDENPLGEDSVTDAGGAFIFRREENGTWNQMQKIVASDREASDFFGFSVSISGSYAIVGAYQEDHGSDGGDARSGAGSAYIFRQEEDGTWHQVRKITASDRETGDGFGSSVVVDRDRVIVGAFDEDHDIHGGDSLNGSGSAYIFELSRTTGVGDNSLDGSISFTPNPVNQTFHIDLGRLYSAVDITIRDLVGRTILDCTYTATDAINVDFDGPAGIYLAIIHTKDGRSTTLKIVKQ